MHEIAIIVDLRCSSLAIGMVCVWLVRFVMVRNKSCAGDVKITD